MSLDWDPSEDYTVFDGLEEITVTSKGARTVADSGTVSYSETTDTVSALKRQVTNRQIQAAGGKLKVGDTMWEVPYMTTITPKIGDTILDASGDLWRVVWVDDKPVISMWRVFGRQ